MSSTWGRGVMEHKTMSLPILEACRKRKRRPKFFNFHNFGDQSRLLTGPFRDNIRAFLQECGEEEEYSVEGMTIWCTLLIIDKNSNVVPLYTVEESARSTSQPFCDHCRCAGWSGNLVSKRRYHFIIPNQGEWNKRLDNGVFDVQTHLLHGLIHSNGFGHLVCINGIEGGSKHLRGREIMDLWDRICSNLRARKISVVDVSKKRCMDLRLLYGVVYGHSWFGRWGYRFCRGSFGVTEQNYTRAIEILSSWMLDQIVQDFMASDQYEELKQTVCYYRGLSETHLITFADLLRFMLTVKSCPCRQKKQHIAASRSSFSTSKSVIKTSWQKGTPAVNDKHVRCRRLSSVICNLDSRWPKRRLEYTAGIIVDTLKERQADNFCRKGMARQDVRDAARKHIGDTGLLDYVLKSLNNVLVGSHIVRRSVNPETRVLEYSIEEVHEPERSFGLEPFPSPPLVPGADLYCDITYLYANVLLNYPDSELVELATQTVLDTKHFVKEWPSEDDEDQLLKFICRVTPYLVEPEPRHLDMKLPPGEIVLLPLHATVGELKRAAEISLRDTYCILEKFVATDIEGREELEDRELLFGAFESGAEVFMRGYGIDLLHTELRYEGGPDNWKVRCECGAQDDDGERMVACDVCEVWHHTRCHGIEDTEAVPPLFVCLGCADYSVRSAGTSYPQMEYQSYDDFVMIPTTSYGEELHY